MQNVRDQITMKWVQECSSNEFYDEEDDEEEERRVIMKATWRIKKEMSLHNTEIQ